MTRTMVSKSGLRDHARTQPPTFDLVAERRIKDGSRAEAAVALPGPAAEPPPRDTGQAAQCCAIA